jgi:hypothetical protein
MPIIPVFHDSTIPIRCQSCDIASMPRFGKQSQSPASRAAGAGRSRQTNPIWPGKRPSGRVFKLSYFSLHFHRIVGGTSCTNEPNFRPACGGGIPTIPLFQYSNPMPILRHRLDAPLRETNPISPAGQGPWGNRAKQSQSRPTSNWGAGRTNKPISGLRLGPGGRSCQTNPNLGEPGYLGDGTAEGLLCKTNPILAGQPGPGRVECAKQTQLPKAGHRGGVRQAGRLGPVDYAKRTQFRLVGPPGAECAKQTQFPGRDTPLFHYSIIPPSQSDTGRAKQSQFTRHCCAPLYKQTQFAEVHHRGTEITEVVLDSWKDMTSISFSVPSASGFPNAQFRVWGPSPW